MKTLIFFLGLLGLSNVALADECPVMRNSQSYEIQEDTLSFVDSFNVSIKGSKAGRITEDVVSWGKMFELKNESGELVATAKERTTTLVTTIDVMDCRGNFVGRLREDIVQSFFSNQTVYSIMNAQNQLVGQSKKLDFFGTDVTFFDASGRLAADLKKPSFNWGSDKWTLNITDGSQVDSRIMFFTGAYKTVADNKRSKK